MTTNVALIIVVQNFFTQLLLIWLIAEVRRLGEDE
jgi:hypothetical protein